METVISQRKVSSIIKPISYAVAIFIVLIALIGILIHTFFDFSTINDKSAFSLKGTSYELVPHVISIIIITVFLLILMVIINRKIKKTDPFEKPKGIVLVVEMFVTLIDNFVLGMFGEKMKSISPYIGFVAIYLFTANIFGLLGFTPPTTANLSVTLTFGLTTFLLVRYYGIKFNGMSHFTGLFNPWPLTPINIIGELAVPFTLSIRLFGNILSGAIIMTLVYTGLAGGFNALLEWIFQTDVTIGGYLIGELLTPFVGVPFLHIYFDLFSGVIQTFVFILLSSVFISNASN